MPLLWRYLLRNFLQVFLLSVLSFIAILLVTRFQSIARFAASGASPGLVFQFVLIQVPHVLPLTIPISCLIASLILFQRMSNSHEITALRVAGLGFTPLFFPLILCGTFIALLNFTIISEISPRCRGYSKSLAYNMTVVNPLCLLQKGSVIKLKNAYVDLKLLKSGMLAEDACFITRNTSNQRLSLIMAKKLSLEGGQLIGEGITLLSSFDPKDPDAFDHLIIENQADMQMNAGTLSQLLAKGKWNLHYDYLNFRMIQAKHLLERGSHEDAPISGVQEIARRFSLALATLAFTLVGMTCGLEIGRQRKLHGVMWAAALMTLYLIAFVTAKSLKHHLIPSLLFFTLPFPILGLFCYLRLKKVSRGVA